jgi:hypothetical protein
MGTRELELPLKGFGAPPTPAQVELSVLTPAERAKRALATLGVFLIVALIGIPIPIVHFVLVPGALVLGVILALARARQQTVFERVEGRCPFCGTSQSFTVMGRFRLPKALNCVNCQRHLVLGGDAVAS